MAWIRQNDCRHCGCPMYWSEQEECLKSVDPEPGCVCEVAPDPEEQMVLEGFKNELS